jgi:hypothetical protein
VNLPVGVVAFVLGRRVLAASARKVAPSYPDYPGVVLLGVSLTSLVLAISEGPAWGWSSIRVLGALVAAVVLGALFLRRSTRHAEPVLDLTLFSARSFAVANAAVFVYAMGFFSMLLGNILFLTSVWHYSILTAGLAVTPGPLVVAVVAGPAGRLAVRYGFRPVLLVGFTVFGAGLAWYALRAGVDRSYLSLWLPGTLVVGLGIGLTFPVLSAAVGVAILVAIIGVPRDAADALARFHHLWWYGAATAALAGVVCTQLRRTPALVVVRADGEADGDSEAAPPTVPMAAPAPAPIEDLA